MKDQQPPVGRGEDGEVSTDQEWDAPPIRVSIDSLLPADALDRTDLDEVLQGFADGSPLVWAAAIALAEPGPSGPIAIEGTDWRVDIMEEAFRAPGFGRSDEKRQDVVIEPPVGVLSVITGETTPTAARDVGRPRLHALIGYMQLRTGLLAGASVSWEGLAYRTDHETNRLASGRNQAFVRVSEAGIEEMRKALTGLQLTELSQHHLLALEWLAEAWRNTATPIRFANLWFAVVVAVDSTFSKSQKKKHSQLKRIEQYLLNLPVSQARRDEFYAAFERAYDIAATVVAQEFMVSGDLFPEAARFVAFPFEAEVGEPAEHADNRRTAADASVGDGRSVRCLTEADLLVDHLCPTCHARKSIHRGPLRGRASRR